MRKLAVYFMDHEPVYLKISEGDKVEVQVTAITEKQKREAMEKMREGF